MYSILFHSDVFMLDDAKNQVVSLQRKMKSYFLSKHFQEHLDNQNQEDRSHTYFKNFVLNILNEQVSDYYRLYPAFEVEYSKDYHFFKKSGWFVTKFCIRVPYKQDEDIAFVFRPMYKDGEVVDFMVVTAWINHKNDNHKTLDTTKYCSKEMWKEKNS